MFFPLRSFRRRLLIFVLTTLACAARGAETAPPPPAANPRNTGTPFIRTWQADDYGAHPENFSVVAHPQNGMIYVGNRLGVLEFDGVRWRFMPGLCDAAVNSLCVDARGRVWGSSGAIIFRLEPDARGELRLRSMLERLPAEQRSLQAVKEGIVTSRGVYFRDLKRLIFFPLDDGPAQVWPVAEGSVVTMRLLAIDDEPYVYLGVPANVALRLRDGKFERVPGLKNLAWAGRRLGTGSEWQLLTTPGVARWDGNELTTLQRPIVANDAQQGIFLPDGRIVFATNSSGLVICDRDGRLLQKLDRAKGLPVNQVLGVAADREGGVWAVMNNGVARVQLDSPYARHGPAQGLEESVTSLTRRDGALFVGGTEGVAVREADGRFRMLPGLPGPDREIVSHGDWLFALSTRLRGVQPALGRPAQELENRNYYGLVPLAGQPGWFAHGSNEGLRWAHFAGDRWISEGPLRTLQGIPRAFLESPAGVVWAGGNTGDKLVGAWRVDFRAGLQANAPAKIFGAAEGMPDRPLAMFLFGGEIVALTGGHLVRFDAAAERFVPEQRIAGIADFPITHAHLTRDGTLWLLGLAQNASDLRRVVPAAGESPAQPTRWQAERLPGEPVEHLVPTALFFEEASQTLWIAAHKVLLSRDLTWQPAHAITPPVAVVRRLETEAGELLAMGDAISPTATLPALDPEQDALRFTFAAPTFVADPTGVVHTEYRTRLDGLDHEWSPWSKETERHFTNLPWRALVLHVQARDAAGRAGPEATCAFSIRPAWWATRWAWAAYGLLGMFSMVGVVRLRTRALRQRSERLEQIVRDRTRELAHSNTQLAASNAELARLHRLELDEKIAAQLSEEKARLEVLRYQLNPHFLYNSLNSIYGLLFENARDAGEMVLRLSEFCRATLTGAKDELPTLGAEIDALRSYLDVEKVRWGEKLQIEFAVAPDAEAVRLPPFLLLPLVENAIKYGSRTSPGVLRLAIRAQHQDGALLITIANTGEWLEPNPARPDSTGIGLENLRQRLSRYYPDAHTFTTEANDGWVIARLSLTMNESLLGLADRPLAETRRA